MTSESVLHLFCTPASRSFVRVVRVGAASRAVGTCDGVRGHGRRTRPRPTYWLLPPFIFFFLEGEGCGTCNLRLSALDITLTSPRQDERERGVSPV